MAFDTTTDDVLQGTDLSGKRMLVTGASGGLGLETTRALAAAGAQVVMAARSAEKNAAAADEIVAAHANAQLEQVQLDLGSLASVEACADALLADGRPLDAVIENAGIMATPQGTTVDGFESQFGVNHLGHFAFACRLAPLLVAGAPSRLVVLSSAGHGMGDVDFDDPNFEQREYHPMVAYGAAKTANALFAVGFDQRMKDHGVRAVAVHPGGIHTDLGRYMTPEVIEALQAQINDTANADPGASGGGFQWKTVPQGAATSVWAAVSPDLDGVGAVYCEDCQIAEERTNGRRGASGVAPDAIDPARADRLWDLSVALTGVDLA